MSRVFIGPSPDLPSAFIVRVPREVQVVVCCWSAKGGQGTSVVALALTLVLARTRAPAALLVDLAGDAPAIAGLPDEPARAGVADWLREGDDVPADGLARLEVKLAHGVSLLPRGSGELPVARAHALTALLASDHRNVVVDAGVVTDQTMSASVAAEAEQSLLVSRSCFLAVRRAMRAPVRPSGVVLVMEEGRALTARDIEVALGAPVRAEVLVDATVARRVDSGSLAHRLPRSLERELRHAA